MRAIMLLVAIFVMFFSILTLGIFAYIAGTTNDLFQQIDFTIENRTFQGTYNETLGVGINAIQDNADIWGMCLLFGMVLLMIVCSFTFSSNKKLLLIIDFVILIIIFIIGGIFQYTYNEFIHSSTEFLDVYSNDLEKSSTFILTLPFIIPVVWLIMMIITYGRFKKKDFEESTSNIQGVGF